MAVPPLFTAWASDAPIMTILTTTPLDQPLTSPSVSIVVPTYHEVENIPHLLDRLGALRENSGLDLELLLMDDDSRDGSEELVRSLNLPWAHIVVRRDDRGLSQAVLDGLRRSKRDMVVVMDADLSHPPETIPAMLDALAHGADFVVGSRFVQGGSTDDDWGFLRWLNSRVATILALPLTALKDPMSGFFSLRRETFLAGRDFNPIGYKIGLELLIKCRCQRVVEVPIHFADRRFGESKLSFKEQLRYLQHLRRLYIYKYGTWSHLAQFLAVGASGLLVNLVLLTLLLAGGMGDNLAVGLSIGLSMLWNFVLNRRFSFSYARNRSIVWQAAGFFAACSLGGIANYFTTIAIWDISPYKQIPALIGVVAGMGFNFVASRFVVFRQGHVKPIAR